MVSAFLSNSFPLITAVTAEIIIACTVVDVGEGDVGWLMACLMSALFPLGELCVVCTLVFAIKSRKNQGIIQVGASCGAWFIASIRTVAIVVVDLRIAQYNIWVIDTLEIVCFVVFAD
jgi:hypothetical protein